MKEVYYVDKIEQVDNNIIIYDEAGNPTTFNNIAEFVDDTTRKVMLYSYVTPIFKNKEWIGFDIDIR